MYGDGIAVVCGIVTEDYNAVMYGKHYLALHFGDVYAKMVVGSIELAYYLPLCRAEKVQSLQFGNIRSLRGDVVLLPLFPLLCELRLKVCGLY